MILLMLFLIVFLGSQNKIVIDKKYLNKFVYLLWKTDVDNCYLMNLKHRQKLW